jgi:integrase/recombinase XerC/integrase/recombinase XerD
MMNISNAVNDWLAVVGSSRSKATYETYKIAMNSFLESIAGDGIKLSSDVSRLKEKHIGTFAAYLKPMSSSTEKVYLTALYGFFRHTNAEELTTFNMDAVRDIIKTRSRKIKPRYPEYPYQEINKVIAFISTIRLSPTKSTRLRELRDIALILTLTDTGLRIHEAMMLKRGDLEGDTVVIIGKGDKQGKIFLTTRSRKAIRRYLAERAELDGKMEVPLSSLPVFSRHDKSAGKKIKSMTPKAGRDAVIKRVVQILGSNQAGITPHKFRHAFVTKILNDTNGNLKLAMELARHSSIQVTDRYAHLTETQLRDGHKKIFEHG